MRRDNHKTIQTFYQTEKFDMNPNAKHPNQHDVILYLTTEEEMKALDYIQKIFLTLWKYMIIYIYQHTMISFVLSKFLTHPKCMYIC